MRSVLLLGAQALVFQGLACTVGCSSSSGGAQPSDAGADAARDAGADGSGDAGADASVTTNIKHVVVIVQENHTFDSYFGRWCTAAAGSSPTCTAGPSCCEAAPAKDPSGASPVALDDNENSQYDPNHTQACELAEINGGKMDRFVTAAVATSCSDPKNFAIADAAAKPYQDLAARYALADRYFQPIAGQSSSNDMYFAVAKYVFTDNDVQPNTKGQACALPPAPTASYPGQTTIADLVVGAGGSFAFYAEGYTAMQQAATCPKAPADCPSTASFPPCIYSPGDNPFAFYPQFADVPKYDKDLADFTTDMNASQLPSLSFVKFVEYKNEHPGYGDTISAGTTAVTQLVTALLATPYANDTLVLITWDEGGGFFDHVAPPADNPADGKPYGTRVPLLALGKFAKKGYVSHVAMEHSSIVKFLEWNFLGGKTGQLGARDTNVKGVGDLLDPSVVGAAAP